MMTPSLRSTAAVALGLAAFTISGCGDSPSPSPSPPAPSSTTPAPNSSTTQPSSGASTTQPGGSTTTPSGAQETSIWAWRKDLDHGVEITYDLSGNMDHSIYGACWRDGNVDTVAETEDIVDDITFVEKSGETGITLHNKRANDDTPGCLLRKSRKQIDLSVISKMELDVSVSGQGTAPGTAPWYSVWLVPMNYSAPDAAEKAAEIDLIENYDWNNRGSDMSGVASNFAQCGLAGVADYTLPFCNNSNWPEVATEVNHHITLTAYEDPAEGRIIEVRRCPNSPEPVETCTDSDFSQIKVTKPNPDVPDWFPLWDKDLVGDNYAKYWLAVDIWWTSNTDFTVTVDNVKFFQDDGTEWKMPLNYDGELPIPEPPAPEPEQAAPAPAPQNAKPPAPEPAPAPAPQAGQCCWGSTSCDAVSNCHVDAFCSASEDQCVNTNCAGVWCPTVVELV